MMPTITYDGLHTEIAPPRYQVIRYHVYVVRLENGYRQVVYVTPEFQDDAGQDRVVQMLADSLNRTPPGTP